MRQVFAMLCLLVAQPVLVGAGFSVSGPQINLEGAGLPTELLFARIDSLEAVIEELEPRDKPAAQYRLSQLYLSSNLIKHRRYALSLLEECLGQDESHFDAAELRAVTAHRMRYTREARRWFEGMCEDFSDDPRSHLALGRFHFAEARRRMLDDRFELALESFRRAVAADSTSVEAWYGRAASALVLQLHAETLQASRHLGRLEPNATRSLFLEAAARAALGEQTDAHLLFTEALETADKVDQAIFLDAQGIISARDLAPLAERVIMRPVGHAALRRQGEDVRPGEEIDWLAALRDPELRKQVLDLFWSTRDRRPAQLFNERELAYWRRLVEADVLFGNPDVGQRGWMTPMGDVYIRFGRPTSTYYDSGSQGGNFDALESAGIRLAPEESVPHDTPVWIWTYRGAGRQYSFLFADPSMNARWVLGGGTAMDVATRRRGSPLHFDAEAPVEPASFEVTASVALFPRPDDRAILETYVGVQFNDVIDRIESGEFIDDPQTDWLTKGVTDSLLALEWAIFDEAEQRLDYRREILTYQHSRSALQRQAGWTSTDDLSDPLVFPIGARISSGTYRLAVEVSSLLGESRRSLSMRVEVPRSEPLTLLQISDLQVASAFTPYHPDQGLAMRYVKYGQVIVPAPGRRIAGGAERMGVYFELSHLSQDHTHRTNFDVLYEVYRSQRELRDRVLHAGFAHSDLERIAPLTASFVEEQTGVSAEGLVIKGAALDVSELGDGNYVLVVTVNDHVGGQSVSQAVAFRRGGS